MKYGILHIISLLLLASTGRGEETNDHSSLFGITVTQTVSNAEQQFMLGHAYYVGDGVDQDLAKAIACYTKAAELGHAQAQFNLGLCYMQGIGVEPSEAHAEKWFRKAAEQNVIEAFYPLGLCCYNQEQYAEAYAWALAAGAAGDSRLKDMLDPMYSEEEVAAGKKRFEELKKTMGNEHNASK